MVSPVLKTRIMYPFGFFLEMFVLYNSGFSLLAFCRHKIYIEITVYYTPQNCRLKCVNVVKKINFLSLLPVTYFLFLVDDYFTSSTEECRSRGQKLHEVMSMRQLHSPFIGRGKKMHTLVFCYDPSCHALKLKTGVRILSKLNLRVSLRFFSHFF